MPDHQLEIPILTTTVEKMVQWARRSAIWPVTFGLACCAIEMMAMSCWRDDIARVGSGGVFDNYAIVQGVDQIVPIDVFVPGCPPRPEALIYGIVQLQRKIDKQRLTELSSESSRVPVHKALIVNG